jgi:hypothetical protein
MRKVESGFKTRSESRSSIIGHLLAALLVISAPLFSTAAGTDAPLGKYSYSEVQQNPIRALEDPKPVAYRASSEIVVQSNWTQFSYEDGVKSNAENIREDPRYAPLDARLNKVYSALRSNLSAAKKEELKRLEKDFLSRRDQLQGDPDAFFALTEKQIGILEQMSGGVSTGAEQPLERSSRESAATIVVATSPDGKYQLTRGKELVIGGSGTTPATLQSNLDISPGRDTKRVLWSPKGDKVLVASAGDEGTNSLQVAWLRGSKWTVDFCPETDDEPRHYLGDNFKVLGWLSDDTFEVTNAIILNSREPLPATRYKVRITANGPAIVN